jgi:hypothetical protein
MQERGAGRLDASEVLRELTLQTGVGKLDAWRGRQLLPLYHPGLLGRVTRNAENQHRDIAVLKTYLAGASGLDLAVMKEVMEATVEGARLRFRSSEGESHDLAFTIGFQVAPAKFAYLSPAGGPPFSTKSRFYIDSMSRVTSNAWLIRCSYGSGVQEIEIRPLEEGPQRAMMRGWLDQQEDEVIEHMESTMKWMLHPDSL